MRTRESTATLWVVRVGASRGVAREALYLDLILYMLSKNVSDGLSLPVSGGGNRCLFLWGALRIVLWGTFPCVRCSVVYGGATGGEGGIV
jgi:hypothetical protein